MSSAKIREERRHFYGDWTEEVCAKAGFGTNTSTEKVDIEYLPRHLRAERRWANIVQKCFNREKQQDFSNWKKWFICRCERPDAKLRLFCLPWAGGNSTSYARWHEAFPDYEIVSVELPGRMMRAREPLVDEIDFIIHSLSTAMQRLALIRGKPFALFGHGYGAVLAYELGRGLHARFRRAPLRLLVAGSRAPPHVRFQERISALAPPELLAHLRALGPAGVPEVILGRPELLDRVKPVLLADQRALESYHHDPNGILPCPVLVLDATGDDIPEEEIRDWELVTDEPVTLREFEGGHFFIQETPGVVLKTIKEVLEEDLENFQRGLQSASLIKKNRYLT